MESHLTDITRVIQLAVATSDSFAIWVKQLWRDKDAQISLLLEKAGR